MEALRVLVPPTAAAEADGRPDNELFPLPYLPVRLGLFEDVVRFLAGVGHRRSPPPRKPEDCAQNASRRKMGLVLGADGA